MTPDPKCANEHEGADTVQHGAFDGLIGDLNALFFGLGLDFFRDLFGLFLCWVFPRQSAGQIITGLRRPIGAGPGWTCGFAFDLDLAVAETCKEGLPGFIDGVGIIGVAGIELFELFRVVPLHEGGGVELVVGGLFGHGMYLHLFSDRSEAGLE